MVYERIARFVERNDVDVSSLARAVGISKDRLEGKLRGETKISAEQYGAICDALRVNLDFFCQQEMSDIKEEAAAGTTASEIS